MIQRPQEPAYLLHRGIRAPQSFFFFPTGGPNLKWDLVFPKASRRAALPMIDGQEMTGGLFEKIPVAQAAGKL